MPSQISVGHVQSWRRNLMLHQEFYAGKDPRIPNQVMQLLEVEFLGVSFR